MKIAKHGRTTVFRTIGRPLPIALLFVASLLMVSSCKRSGPDTLMADRVTGSVDLGSSPSMISDGATSGIEGFFFLPPMAKSSSFHGTFDPALSPVVEICETPACTSFHARFSMTDGTGSETVRLNEDAEYYTVNWHTDRTGATAGETYRVRVRIGNALLGYADAQIASSGKEARNLDTNEAIALVDGRTLPIKFRIETDMTFMAFAMGPAGGEITALDGTVTLDFPEGAIDVETVITAEPIADPVQDSAILPGLVFQFGPSGAQFDPAVKLTIKYDHVNLGVMDEDRLRVRKLIGDRWVQVAGSSIDITTKTVSAPLTSFSIYGVGTDDAAFVTRWDTNLGDGTTVTIGLAGNVNATIDWGDGTVSSVTEPGPHVKDYLQDGVYTVAVTGSVTAYNSRDHGGGASERSKLIAVAAWGEVGFTNLSNAFDGATNLTVVPADFEGSENVRQMGHMFHGATSFDSDIGAWDTRNVSVMTSMFHGATSFNQHIGGWDTGSVRSMNTMFLGATAFNRDIGGWDTGEVRGMSGMFSGATAFDQDIGAWNTTNVQFMNGMFSGATVFNQDIGAWDTGNVTNFLSMFRDATSFNQDIGSWNTGKVTNMAGMFSRATAFNQDLSGWCVELIEEQPSSFDFGVTGWLLPRPLWGTCPSELDPCSGVACPVGFSCYEGTCFVSEPDYCDGVVCADGHSCYGGTCFYDCTEEDTVDPEHFCYEGPEPDACSGVVCGDGYFCYGGACFQGCSEEETTDPQNFLCFTGCPEGETLDEENSRCVGDACSGVVCGDGYFCYGGACFQGCSEEEKSDPDNFLCYDGSEPDACAGVVCGDGYFCYGGACFQGCSEAETTDPENFLCFTGCPEGETLDEENTRCISEACAGVTCSTGYVCHGGACYQECTEEEATDPENFLCFTGCPEGEILDEENTRCVGDACAGVTCSTGYVCHGGACYQGCTDAEATDPQNFLCFTGCPEGETLDEENTRCISEACAGVTCSTGYVCHGGACYQECTDAEATDPQNFLCFTGCPEGEILDEENGLCILDPCGGVECPDGHACYGGTCFPACTEEETTDPENDLCFAGCPDGEILDEDTSRCVSEACAGVECPDGHACYGGTCFLMCTEEDRTDPDHICYEGSGLDDLSSHSMGQIQYPVAALLKMSRPAASAVQTSPLTCAPLCPLSRTFLVLLNTGASN
jgi:surface protein